MLSAEYCYRGFFFTKNCDIDAIFANILAITRFWDRAGPGVNELGANILVSATIDATLSLWPELGQAGRSHDENGRKKNPNWRVKALSKCSYLIDDWNRSAHSRPGRHFLRGHPWRKEDKDGFRIVRFAAKKTTLGTCTYPLKFLGLYRNGAGWVVPRSTNRYLHREWLKPCQQIGPRVRKFWKKHGYSAQSHDFRVTLTRHEWPVDASTNLGSKESA